MEEVKKEEKEISLLLFKTVYLESNTCPDIEKIVIEDDIIKGYYTCSSKGIATCLACEISVNDFVFLLKEWAFKEGYDMNSCNKTCSVFILPTYEPLIVMIKSIYSEQYSIIKAGEQLVLYIFHNNKELKNG